MAEEEQPQQYGRRALFSMNFSTLMSAREEVRKLLIATPGQWQDLAKKINDPDTHDTFAFLYYQVTQDIDFNNEKTESIGIYGYPFTGTLDGQNHTLSGLNMLEYRGNVGDNTPVNYAAQAPISVTDGALVKDLTLENLSLSANSKVSAGLIGIANNTTVENVVLKQASFHFHHEDTSGGLIGSLTGESFVRNCAVDVQEVGSLGVMGGLIGKTEGTATVDGCWVRLEQFYQSDNSVETCAGGIVGQTAGALQIADCLVSNIDYSSLTADYVGGILGNVASGGSASINRCIVAAYQLKGGNAAGIANGASAIENCVNISHNINITTGETEQTPLRIGNAATEKGNFAWGNMEFQRNNVGVNTPTSGDSGQGTTLTLTAEEWQANNTTWNWESAGYTAENGWQVLATPVVPVLTELPSSMPQASSLPAWITPDSSYTYTIGTVEELQAFAAYINSGKTVLKDGKTYPAYGTGVTFKLTADLDMANVAWTPIGKDEAHPFRGTFTGAATDDYDHKKAAKAYSIKNLNGPLFGVIEGGNANANNGAKTTVSSFALVNQTVNVPEGPAGGVACIAKNVYMNYCLVQGTVSGSGAVGGIVGTESMTIVDTSYSMAYALSNGGQTTEKVGCIVGVLADDNSSRSVTAANGGWRGMQLNGSAISDNGTNRHQGIDLVYADSKLKKANGSAFDLYGSYWSTPVYDMKPTELETMPKLYGSYYYGIGNTIPTPLEGQISGFPAYFNDVLPSADTASTI